MFGALFRVSSKRNIIESRISKCVYRIRVATALSRGRKGRVHADPSTVLLQLRTKECDRAFDWLSNFMLGNDWLSNFILENDWLSNFILENDWLLNFILENDWLFNFILENDWLKLTTDLGCFAVILYI